MHMELRSIETLRPYEQNPCLNDKAVEAVARGLQEFGFRQPIIVDSDGVIICGHTRWKAARKLGLKQVPVNPLYAAGYRSLGCEPCTRIATGADERAGRWLGTSKCGGECGIHTRPLKLADGAGI